MSTSTPAPIKVEVIPEEKAKILPRAVRESRYKPILDAMAALKPGQAIKVPLPPRTTATKYGNRLASVIRGRGISAPEGHIFSKRAGEGDTLVIVLAKVAGAGRKKKAKASK